jgi:hypothetical protein
MYTDGGRAWPQLVRCAFANTGALFQTEWTEQRRPNEVRRTGVELRKSGAEGGGERSPTERSERGGRVKERRKTDKREEENETQKTQYSE